MVAFNNIYVFTDILYQEFIIKKSEGEYPTLTIPCTNALRKVRSVNYPVLWFCINTLREIKDALIGVNIIVLVSMLTTQDVPQ